MKNKGAVKFLAILLAIVCLYELSFTFVTAGVEDDAKEWAVRMAGDDSTQVKKLERQYLDSMAYRPVYNLLVKEFTFLEAKEKQLNLGLDLQGGMSVTLEVSVPSILEALSKNSKDSAFVKSLRIAEERQKSSEADFVTLFSQAWNEINPEGKLSIIFSNKDNKDNIPTTATNEQVLTYLRSEAKAALGRSLQIVRSRVDRFGVTQPNVQLLEGSGRILVELPGVDNPTRVRKLLEGSAKLEFWETYTFNEAYNQFMTQADVAVKNLIAKQAGKETIETTTVDSTSTDNAVTEEITTETLDSNGVDSAALAAADTTGQDTGAQKSFEEFTTENPFLATVMYAGGAVNPEGFYAPDRPIVGLVRKQDVAKVNEWLAHPDVKKALPIDVVFMWGKDEVELSNGDALQQLYALRSSRVNNGPVLPGDVIVDARRDITQTGEVVVSMNMNTKGETEWKKITTKAAENNHASIAIVLDGIVYSAPSVTEPIPNGSSQIRLGNGANVRDEAEDLANILKAGKLPAPARIVEEAIVGPSLGQKSIEQGTTALIVGFLAVIVFMVIYYMGGGIVSVFALLANLFFILGALASKGAALTLPGIAGLVLTIGMSVDANVLIFERIREELRLGKGLKTAISNGYKAAFSSIIDANVTTLLAGIVLIIFGSGPVYGFAIILIIGIISSLFTAILVTRLLFEGYLKKDRTISFGSKATNNLFNNINFNFIAKRKIAYVVSSIIILAGTVSLFTKGLSQGVDFSGGWSYTVQFHDDAKAGDIRAALATPFESAPEVKTFGSGNTFKITTTYLIDENDTASAGKVKNALLTGLAAYNITDADIQQSSKVGPTIADDIKRDSTWAVIFAIIGIFIYIVIRFRKWQYGLGATVALFHDVMMVFSAFTLLDGIVPFTLEVDQAFIAAILTVIGYSINDTVVVFDRIREFLALHRTEKDTTKVINNAINQTLSRSLITSLTTLLVVLILFLFGGEVLKGFSFALLIGILVGTYSSVFIATPIVVDLTTKDKK